MQSPDQNNHVTTELFNNIKQIDYTGLCEAILHAKGLVSLRCDSAVCVPQ
jgi:hypothetical protein